MSKKLVVVDRESLRDAIEKGDNCDGGYVLAVSPDGETSIHWSSNTSQWDSWGKDDVIISIPAMIPEGDGEYYYEAESSFDWGKNGNPTLEKVEEMVDNLEYNTPFAWMEENAQDWVEAYRDNALDWLESAFENLLNGYGDDLNDPDPWRGQEIDGRSPEDVFEFEVK